jgi:integrase
VTAAGHRSFVLNYRTRGGRERRYTIGDAGGEGGWTIGAARIRARELRRLIDGGGDPLGEIEAEREAPTVADLIERFEQEHLTRKRASTAAEYKHILDKHVGPHFGEHVKVADVTHDDIIRLHSRITKAGHPYRANAMVRVASKMFSLATRWNMRPDNPCRGIERNYESKRRRYLSGDELARLTAALAKHPDKQSANVFRLLLLTGARRGEVLAMRWADIDFGAKLWSKQASTSKQRQDHVVPLSAPTLQLLSEIRAAQSSKKRALGEYVFPGRGNAQHVVNVKRAWRSICKAAKISALRVHDLRHSFASQLASGGASLPLIGALLGHSNPTTTARYSHLFDDPQRKAVETVAAIIVAAGRPAPKPELIRSKRGRRP